MTAMMYFAVPADRELLAAFGEVTLRHEHLNHILRMTIKTLTRLSVNEALDATARDGSALLRDRIRKFARQRLGQGEPLLRLQAIIERCSRATDTRNDLVHSVWAKELDGETVRRNSTHGWQATPTVEELRSLAEEIASLTAELNHARLEGFLHEALAAR
jgi:hypothetical protein